MTSIPVLSATEAAAWDTVSRTQFRIPSRVLMEAAGRATVQVLIAEFPDVVTQGDRHHARNVDNFSQSHNHLLIAGQARKPDPSVEFLPLTRPPS